MGGLGWLIGASISSLVGAFFVVRFAQFALGSVVEVAGSVKNTLFVGTWTAITTASGMRSFTKSIRGLRKRTSIPIEEERKETS